MHAAKGGGAAQGDVRHPGREAVAEGQLYLGQGPTLGTVPADRGGGFEGPGVATQNDE